MSRPNLSQIANNSWDTDFDVDSIIAQESATFTPATVTNNTPVVHQSNVPTTSNPFESQYNEILDRDVALPNKSLANTAFKDSGTITPQQNLNQPANNATQQASNDSQESFENDPYLLAFNILQDFDLIRLPENIDLSKLDEQTLLMYKEETIQEQRNEALNYVRSQVGNDPLMTQLFDYAYYGKKFADLPKMQTTLKEIYDFNNYDITSEAKQKAIVKLYYSDGLNPSDDRDKKVLGLIPVQIEQLTKDLQLREEAIKAKQFFINRGRQKAAAEEQRVLALIQQQDAIERQRELDNKKWNDAFMKALQAKKWSEGKKASVLNETKFVTLESGEQMPLWQYKQNLMLEDPNLFQAFLDFTSQFNINNNNFKVEESADEVVSQSTLNKIVERLQGKSNLTVHGQGGASVNNPNKKQPLVASVHEDWGSTQL